MFDSYTSTNQTKVIGLYFGASYCKWCHKFSPTLKNIYPYLRKFDIEILFVGSDKTETEFDKYRNTHPWPAIRYDDPLREQLRKYYDIQTIPALVFVTSSGEIIEAEGRDVLDKLSGKNSVHDTAQLLFQFLGLCEYTEYDSDDSEF